MGFMGYMTNLMRCSFSYQWRLCHSSVNACLGHICCVLLHLKYVRVTATWSRNIRAGILVFTCVCCVALVVLIGCWCNLLHYKCTTCQCKNIHNYLGHFLALRPCVHQSVFPRSWLFFFLFSVGTPRFFFKRQEHAGHWASFSCWALSVRAFFFLAARVEECSTLTKTLRSSL